MSGRAAVGVADHAGWAILVVAGPDGALADRRRVELLDPDLPCLAYHHDAQHLPPDEAVALIARVTASAERHAAAALAALPGDVGAIALRACPPMPATVLETIADYRAQCVADTVMIRRALAGAAEARGWAVSWYGRKPVLDAWGPRVAAAGQAAGRPWTQDHRWAYAAALGAIAIHPSNR